MEARKSRRRFLGLASAGASGAVLLGAREIKAEDPPKKDKAEKKTFKGTSKKSNLQEALGLAITAAHKAAPGVSDHLVQWTLKDVSGSDGGIAGLTELTVTIEVS